MSKFTGNIVFIYCCVVTLVVGVYIAKEECPPNEEYLLCGTACPFNCSNPGPVPVTCSDDCIEGCFCKSGFLRNDTGECVNADECIGETNPICSANEEFLACGTACARTCTDPEPLNCGLACSMGCFCKSGYVRNQKTNKCVTLDKCPVSLVELCLNQNEVYDLCLASCEPSCADPTPICSKKCTGGCVCAPGLLRDGFGDCVSVDKCGNGNSTDGALKQYMDIISKIMTLSKP
ncbi:serine protease inhibitor swm-1-like [Cydia amplana]|uniref:serine protease inhibitor swm-1-like n=1 Tax=Cydia amplana TaxID=1869771 RepID=UPI002FE5E340